MRITRWVVGSCLGLSALSATAATIFSFSNFSDCTGLQINGNAACTTGVLRLTPATFGQAGSAFSTTTVQLGAGASFSTFFTFQMSNAGGASDGDGLGADGIVFVVQPISSTVGSGGGGIGYLGIANSLGIEFDTWNNGAFANDPDGNHVGVDLAGSIASVATMPIPTRMNDGNVWSAWVDYNGTVIELRVSQTNVRPATPTLSFAVDLASVLGTTQAFVGFTAGSGAAFENHDILTWQFNSGFEPIGAAAAPVNIPVLSPIALVLAGLLLAFVAATRLRGRRGEA